MFTALQSVLSAVHELAHLMSTIILAAAFIPA